MFLGKSEGVGAVYRHSNKRSTRDNTTMKRKFKCEMRTDEFHRVGEVGGCIYGRFRGILRSVSTIGRVSTPVRISEMATPVQRHCRSNDTVARETIGRLAEAGTRPVRVRPIARVESSNHWLLKRGGTAGFPSWQQGGFLRPASETQNRDGAAGEAWQSHEHNRQFPGDHAGG